MAKYDEKKSDILLGISIIPLNKYEATN